MLMKEILGMKTMNIRVTVHQLSDYGRVKGNNKRFFNHCRLSDAYRIKMLMSELDFVTNLLFIQNYFTFNIRIVFLLSSIFNSSK